MVLLYFKIGNSILEKQKQEKWGAKIIERISQDLKIAFPEMTGFSTTNLDYMRRFADSIISKLNIDYSSISQQAVGKLRDIEIVQQVVGQFPDFFNIPWGHNVVLMNQVSSNEQQIWYASQTIANGWSRNILMHQIKSNLYKRQVASSKTHNFHLTLPSPDSELVANILKDEYNFEFLRGNNFKEKELEDCLTENIVKLLLELGKGFAFVGKQYNLQVGGQDFFIDLLFYNLELRCFVVIELKTGEFRPEYAGKLGFYLSVVDEELKKVGDNFSIGIILCAKNNKEISKHSVRYMMKPIGVSEYKISDKITDKKMKKILPSVEEMVGLGG